MNNRFFIGILFCWCLFPCALRSQNYDKELKKVPTKELLNCLFNYEVTCIGDHYDWENELARRRQIDTLIHAFNSAPFNVDGGLFRDSLERTLYLIARRGDDLRIDRLMRRELNGGTWEGDYYTALYLAEKGNRKALATLNANCWKYGLSSVQWSDALTEFGQQRYRPAIPCLIRSVDAASLNAGDAAYRSLLVFYPDAPKDLPSAEAARTYFAKRYTREKAQKQKARY